jgi:hypothetical protein
VVLSDIVAAVRRYGIPALISGAIGTLAGAILASNVIIGANLGGPAGWLLSTFAAMGLFALWVYGIAFWILLVDPDREDRPAMTRARAALLLSVAMPGRLSWLALLLFLLLSVSTVAIVALLTIAPAYALLVSGRYVLPRADRLERWYEDRRAAGP